ncbi:MAG: hypothetical protein ONB46_07190 [candidate division KSB1 bacterium]|nr:hypothetical protein [candidate division KSB1 bacterium]MDZ7368303.1 hypothetical protein [candidate division KSB1 bacterium]MDZ7406117.1 hypothetical protein [candidate division KSB1 bacterium]
MPKVFTQANWMERLRQGKSIYSYAELMRLTKLSAPALRRALTRLGNRQFLVSLGKNLYANTFQMPALEEIASVLYPPAYISLESALFRHGVIDQAPHVVHCATLNKTKSFSTALGEIAYFHIKPDLFFGYGAQDRLFPAAPEQAALDFVYLQRQNGLAPNLDEWNWNHLDRNRLQEMLAPYPETVKKHLTRFM